MLRWLILTFLFACGGGTTTTGSDAGTDGGGGGDSGVDLSKLGTPCQSGACPAGLEPVTYCGFTGCGGGTMCSCEIRCGQDSGACPPGTACAFISDGPGEVCVKN